MELRNNKAVILLFSTKLVPLLLWLTKPVGGMSADSFKPLRRKPPLAVLELPLLLDRLRGSSWLMQGLRLTDSKVDLPS